MLVIPTAHLLPDDSCLLRIVSAEGNEVWYKRYETECAAYAESVALGLANEEDGLPSGVFTRSIRRTLKSDAEVEDGKLESFGFSGELTDGLFGV
jgi:hypothetical protein